MEMLKKPGLKLSSLETHPKPSEEATPPLVRSKQPAEQQLWGLLNPKPTAKPPLPLPLVLETTDTSAAALLPARETEKA